MGTGIAAGRANLGRDLLEALRGARGQQHGGASSGEPARGRLAEAIGGTGDQHHLPGDGVPQLRLLDSRRRVDQWLGRSDQPRPRPLEQRHQVVDYRFVWRVRR